MKSIKSLLAFSFVVLVTFLTGCATSASFQGGEVIAANVQVLKGVEAYDAMVRKFNLQDLDLSDPNFVSLKDNMVCYMDYNKNTKSEKEALTSNCHSKNDKVWFVFGNRADSTDERVVIGFAQGRSNIIRKDGNFNIRCSDAKLQNGVYQRDCEGYEKLTGLPFSKFNSYVFRKNRLYIAFGEKNLKEENDSTSLIPKIRELLIKVK